MKKTYVKPETSSLSFGSGEVMESGINTASLVLRKYNKGEATPVEEERGIWYWEKDVDQASKDNDVLNVWDD